MGFFTKEFFNYREKLQSRVEQVRDFVVEKTKKEFNRIRDFVIPEPEFEEADKQEAANIYQKVKKYVSRKLFVNTPPEKMEKIEVPDNKREEDLYLRYSLERMPPGGFIKINKFDISEIMGYCKYSPKTLLHIKFKTKPENQPEKWVSLPAMLGKNAMKGELEAGLKMLMQKYPGVLTDLDRLVSSVTIEKAIKNRQLEL